MSTVRQVTSNSRASCRWPVSFLAALLIVYLSARSSPAFQANVNLYIGVTCNDSEPSRAVATQMARDADLSVDDHMEILIDTYRDRRNGFYFATNPLGALVDGLIIENGQLNREWDAIWQVRTRRFERGWTAGFIGQMFKYPFPPSEVVEFFRAYYGPTHRAFASLDSDKQAALRSDLERLWSEHNKASDGGTSVESEYLEVVAVRA